MFKPRTEALRSEARRRRIEERVALAAAVRGLPLRRDGPRRREALLRGQAGRPGAPKAAVDLGVHVAALVEGPVPRWHEAG